MFSPKFIQEFVSKYKISTTWVIENTHFMKYLDTEIKNQKFDR